MIHTIRVQTVKGKDPLGESLLEKVRQLGYKGITKIRTAKVYRVEGADKIQAKKLAIQAFSEAVNQIFTIDKPLPFASSITSTSSRKRGRNISCVEIAYKSGVMNPEAISIIKVAEDLGIHLTAADSSREYIFYGNIAKNDLNSLLAKLNIYNPVIEQVVIEEPKTLRIEGKIGKTNVIPIRNANESQLMKIAKADLFLNLKEMKVIQEYFQRINRDPTDCELEVIAQTWSEHCVHKTFKAIVTIDGKKKKPFIARIKETAKGYNHIVSAFVDNSGVIDFYDGYAICGKVETHNSPSAIEPYGGAMTGSGGVFRDILGTGQGAKILMSTDVFCFAPPYLSPNSLPPGCLPPDYLLERVVAGVRDYGNRVGIPTNNGSIHFHPDFRAKPTVAVGAYGILEKKKAQKGAVKPHDLIATIGGRTGRDGIHGATFSSGEMTDRTINTSVSAVQIGNAIEEKRIIDVVLALSKQGIIRAITDCGAGGYSSAIGEMGKNTGAKVYLDKVPLKYAGLAPWEIFLSESQERMIIAIDPKHRKKFMDICSLYNVEASIIGEFTSTRRLEVLYANQVVCNLEMRFLHDGLPQRHMVGISKNTPAKYSQPPALPKNILAFWKKILSDPNVSSKESIVRQYDHTVQGSNALPPFGGVAFDAPNDGAIIKPFLDKKYGLLTAHGLNPVLNKIDPYWGSIWAITEAVSNYVAIGGDLKTAALIDNFIWPVPDEASLADLDKSVDACVEMSKLLHVPFVSGKDSLSNTYRYKNGRVLKIPPVLLISVFGKIPDVTKTASSDFKRSDSVIVFVGIQDTNNMGGSIYCQYSSKYYSSSHIPKVNINTLAKTLQAVTKGIQNGSILSCHDVSEGGIAVALSEMCFGGGCGATIDLANISTSARHDFLFFNETTGTFLVEVKDELTARKHFQHVPHIILGKTNKTKTITVLHHKKILAKASIKTLKKAWQMTMRQIFN